MALTRRRVADAAALKALAHPVRIALLELLVADGPLTASEAAERVGESPSNCSWHLRRLAAHGFVRESRRRTGRERPWQAVHEGLTWAEDPPGAEETPTSLAAEALGDSWVEREVQRLRAARASRDTEPLEWREATGLVHAQLWLTAAEAQDLKEALSQLLARHGERATRPQIRPEAARRVSLVGWLVPSGPTAAQRSSSGEPASVAAT